MNSNKKPFFSVKIKPMNNQKMEGTFAIVASLLVLFTAMIEPLTAAVLSGAALGIFGIYELSKKD